MQGKLSLRPRSDEGEQVLLRRALLDDLDRLLQLRIIVERATAHRGVAKRRARNAKLEVTIDQRCRGVPLLAVDLDARLLQAREELVPPLRLDDEIGLHLRLELVAEVVEGDVILL